MNPNVFVNVFNPEDFIKGPDGLSRLKDSSHIYRKIRELCEEHNLSYMWQGVTAGYNNGIPFFVGNLTFLDRSTKAMITHVGSAESPEENGRPLIGLSGVSLIALQNAALRGFGMAEFLYSTEQKMRIPAAPTTPSATATPTQYIKAGPVATSTTEDELLEEMRAETAYNLAKSQAARAESEASKPAYQKRTPGPGPGKAPTAAKPAYTGKQSEWTGYDRNGDKICIKSGANEGKAWMDMPIEYIQKLANMDVPNEVAKKELDRRMKASGRTPQVANPFVQEETNDDW